MTSGATGRTVTFCVNTLKSYPGAPSRQQFCFSRHLSPCEARRVAKSIRLHSLTQHSGTFEPCHGLILCPTSSRSSQRYSRVKANFKPYAAAYDVDAEADLDDDAQSMIQLSDDAKLLISMRDEQGTYEVGGDRTVILKSRWKNDSSQKSLSSLPLRLIGLAQREGQDIHEFQALFEETVGNL